MLNKVGFIVGRFQPMHSGHLEMMRRALELCDNLVILVGSSQESRTEKNPFTFEERAGFIRRAIRTILTADKTVLIFPLPDRGVGDNEQWGSYVLDTLEKYVGERPHLTFSGYEERRKNWYEGLGVIDIMLDKSFNASATELRDVIRKGFSEEVDYPSRLHELLPCGLRDVKTVEYMKSILANIKKGN